MSVQKQSGVLTLRRFYDERFARRVALKRPNTQIHYRTVSQLVLDGLPTRPVPPGAKERPVRSHGMGDAPLNAIALERVQDFIDIAHDRGYSTSMLRHIRSFLRCMY